MFRVWKGVVCNRIYIETQHDECISPLFPWTELRYKCEQTQRWQVYCASIQAWKTLLTSMVGYGPEASKLRHGTVLHVEWIFLYVITWMLESPRVTKESKPWTIELQTPMSNPTSSSAISYSHPNRSSHKHWLRVPILSFYIGNIEVGEELSCTLNQESCISWIQMFGNRNISSCLP